jgi:aspartate/methionine/tyrosine aminotransferase
MDLPPFLLDQWLTKYDFASPPIEFNLASSTGPRWSVGELMALGGMGVEITDTVLKYAPPEGSRAVREAVADFCGVDPEWVVMTTGASEALSLLICCAERPNGNLVIPDPAYPAYASMAQAWRLNVRRYSLTNGDCFALERDAVLAAVNGDTVAVIVNTPHNPTGSVMPHSEIEALAVELGEKGVPLIVDEVHHPLHYGSPQRSAASIENVIVTSDLSKAMSLPGLRTGWLVDRNKARRDRLIDARSTFAVSGSPLLEQLAAHALANRAAIFDRLRTVATSNLERLDVVMTGSGGALSWSRPQGGTACFPKFKDGRDSRAFCEALADAGVLVAPGDCFGHPSHMRIGFAQQADRFDVATDRFAAVLAGTAD